MKKEKNKIFNVHFEWKVDLTGVIIIIALLAFFWSTNNNINSMNERIDVVYEVLIKSGRDIVDMKEGIENRFTNIEKGLAFIERGINSLQPRDDSLKEGEPPTETSPYQEGEPPTRITPYQEGESGQKTTPYQSP